VEHAAEKWGDDGAVRETEDEIESWGEGDPMVVVVDTASRDGDVIDGDDDDGIVVSATRSNGDDAEGMCGAVVVDDDDAFMFISPSLDFDLDSAKRASNKPFMMNPKSWSCLDKALSISLEM